MDRIPLSLAWVRSHCAFAVHETVDGIPIFSCSPDSNPADVAMEASAHARLISGPVNFVCDGETRQIGPEDVFFRHRPEVVSG